MKSRSGKVRWKYLGLGLTFGVVIGLIMQTILWGMTLGLAIGLTWEFAQIKKHRY